MILKRKSNKMKNKEPCINKCKFRQQNTCSLYDHIELESALIPDKYDEGYIHGYLKCNDCLERELSNSIDKKVDEIRDIYNIFVYEMDLLMNELNKLKIKRRSIYE